MKCLDCGFDNPYRSKQCQGCGFEFALFPPFVEANHISQLLDVIKCYKEDECDFDIVADYAESFLTIYQEYRENWGLTRLEELKQGLPQALAQAMKRPISILEEGLTLFEQVAEEMLSLLEEASREPDTWMALGDTMLEAFRITCMGAADMLYVLENNQKKEEDGGAYYNVSV